MASGGIGTAIVRGVLVALAAATMGVAEDDPRAYSPDEPPFSAQLAGIDREWNFSFRASGKVRVVAAKELAYWGRCRDVESGPQILLAGGGVIRADVLALDEGRLTLGDATGLGRGLWEESSLPRQVVRAILFQPPAATDQRDRLLIALHAERGAEDRLQLIGGETVTGTLTAAPRAGRFAAENVPPGGDVFELVRRGATQPLAIPAVKVVAVSFGSTVRPPRPTGPAAWLGFADGSYAEAGSVSVKSGIVTVTLVDGGELRARLAGRDEREGAFWNAITYVEPVNARIEWLSRCAAVSYKQIPFLTVQRPLAADQSVLGTRLRSGGAVFHSGLGMPSAARVAYDVAGYRKFQAELAVDDAAGLRGSVIFKVMLEGPGGSWQAAYESPTIRGGEPPLAMSVDLKSALRMVLIVEFADRGDECDYADWLCARLVR